MQTSSSIRIPCNGRGGNRSPAEISFDLVPLRIWAVVIKYPLFNFLRLVSIVPVECGIKPSDVREKLTLEWVALTKFCNRWNENRAVQVKEKRL